MSLEIVNPESLGVPRGWNHAMLAPAGARLLFVAGQTARDATGRVPAIGFVEQWGRALDNVVAVVRAAGGSVTDIARLTIYVTDMDAYRESLQPIGAAYRERMGKHFPAMALVEVTSLVDREAMVEIEATAVVSRRRRRQAPGERRGER